VCYNEGECIDAGLESPHRRDAFVVTDSFSTDKTVEICRAFMDRLIPKASAEAFIGMIL